MFRKLSRASEIARRNECPRTAQRLDTLLARYKEGIEPAYLERNLSVTLSELEKELTSPESKLAREALVLEKAAAREGLRKTILYGTAAFTAVFIASAPRMTHYFLAVGGAMTLLGLKAAGLIVKVPEVEKEAAELRGILEECKARANHAQE